MLQNCQAKNLSLHNDTSNNSVWKVKIVFLTLNQIFCYWLFCQLVNAPVHVAVWRFPTRLEHTSQSWCKPGYKMPTKLSLLSCTCFQSGTQLYIHFQRFFVPLQTSKKLVSGFFAKHLFSITLNVWPGQNWRYPNDGRNDPSWSNHKCSSASCPTRSVGQRAGHAKVPIHTNHN